MQLREKEKSVSLGGHPGRPLAGVLGVFPAAVYRAARRGAAQAPTWQRLLGRERQET